MESDIQAIVRDSEKMPVLISYQEFVEMNERWDELLKFLCEPIA